MIEIARALEWIHDTLSADATLAGLVGDRIFDGLAPQGSAYPFVVFNHQGGGDLMAVGAARVFDNSLYQIKAVTEGESYVTATAIADRIDTVLHAASGSANGGSVLMCVREQSLMLIEQRHGVEYRSVGGLFRLYTQES